MKKLMNLSQRINIVLLTVFLLFILQLENSRASTDNSFPRSEYGIIVERPNCGGNPVLNNVLKKFGRGCIFKRVTFTCQEELWHVPETWKVIIDEINRSKDLASGTYTKGRYILQTGLWGRGKHHLLDKMDPWVFIPIKKTDDFDKNLVIHQQKLTGVVVVNKRVFDKENGYQNKEYKYYCRQSAEDYKP